MMLQGYQHRKSILHRLWTDDRGGTIVEFGIIVAPLCLMLLGGLDLAYQSYARSITEGALNQAARQASVETPEFNAKGDSINEQVKNQMSELLLSLSQDAKVKVETKSYFDFSGVGNAERLMTDYNENGEYDQHDKDCFEDANDNGEFDLDSGADGRGGANDVIFYTANVTIPRLLPWHKFTDSVSPTIDMVVETAVRTQPYDDQPTPAVLCGV